MRIDGYRFGRIEIGGRAYSSDVIVWPEGVDDSWWRVEGHGLCEKDLEPLLDKRPDVLIIGTGANGLMAVPPAMVEYMAARCAEVHVERTERACEVYNELAGGERRVVAGLHLTC